MLTTLVYAFIYLSQPAATLRVGTFNCEFMNREKVQIKYGYRFNLENEDLEMWSKPQFREDKFRQALKPVARTIHKMKADVMVLTEVGGRQDVSDLRDAIAKAGTDYPYFWVSDSTNPAFQHVAILGRIPLDLVTAKIPGRAFYDPEPDDPEEERETDVQKAIHVTFQFQAKTIHVIGVHLPSERNGYRQDMMRVTTAQLIRRYSYPIIESGEPVIIVGDLNDDRGEPAIRMIRGKEDIFEDLIETGGTAFFPPSEWKNRWTYMFKGQRNQLDHILISRSLLNACLPLEEHGVQARVYPMDIHFRPSLKQPRTSDHRPFLVEFKFK